MLVEQARAPPVQNAGFLCRSLWLAVVVPALWPLPKHVIQWVQAGMWHIGVIQCIEQRLLQLCIQLHIFITALPPRWTIQILIEIMSMMY